MADDAQPVDLINDGLLWLINRVVFHPRGFALGIGPEGAFLQGDGSELWAFSPCIDEDGKFEAVAAALDRVRRANGG